MEQKYTHITIEERCEIARLQTLGSTIRQIAAALDRSPSTISREMKRNCRQNGQYQPSYADQQSRSRRWTGSKLDRNLVLREMVLSRLSQGWSPEQVAGRFAKDSGTCVISYETIYRFIYAQIARTKDYS
ncbi:MAG: helix-turn-helix domain-containing protein, partial [Desulfobulbaceae bacterium]|nr:helix-turn-helix domain-containing protein [Desulfobulbaceae bacterium]